MCEVATPPSGCLTDAQLAELQAAAPGKAPENLARHLATCERCQTRALFDAERPTGKKKNIPEFPSVRRAILLNVLVLVAITTFFWSLAKLTGRLQ
jgi:hypothetical protein